MSKKDLDSSFLDNQEGDKRKNVRYRLDGGGQQSKVTIIGEIYACAATSSTSANLPPPLGATFLFSHCSKTATTPSSTEYYKFVSKY